MENDENLYSWPSNGYSPTFHPKLIRPRPNILKKRKKVPTDDRLSPKTLSESQDATSEYGRAKTCQTPEIYGDRSVDNFCNFMQTISTDNLLLTNIDNIIGSCMNDQDVPKFEISRVEVISNKKAPSPLRDLTNTCIESVIGGNCGNGTNFEISQIIQKNSEPPQPYATNSKIPTTNSKNIKGDVGCSNSTRAVKISLNNRQRKRNLRERNRVKMINRAFTGLKQRLPPSLILTNISFPKRRIARRDRGLSINNYKGTADLSSQPVSLDSVLCDDLPTDSSTCGNVCKTDDTAKSKISKVETLRLAIDYINHLQTLLHN